MTAEVWLLTLGGQAWLWIQDGLDAQADRAFLARHPEATNVTEQCSAALGPERLKS